MVPRPDEGTWIAASAAMTGGAASRKWGLATDHRPLWPGEDVTGQCAEVVATADDKLAVH